MDYAFILPFVIGVALTAASLLVFQILGLHRDRGASSTTLIAIALFYVVFSVEHGTVRVVIIQSALAFSFIALAMAGYRRSLWLVVAGLAGHGIYDIFAHSADWNPAPGWWGPFCLAVDLMLAGALAHWIRRGDVQA